MMMLRVDIFIFASLQVKSNVWSNISRHHSDHSRRFFALP